MQIAVFTSEKHILHGNGEYCFRCITGLELMTIHAILGNHLYKSNVVLLFHGMSDASHGYFDLSTEVCNLRDVFLKCCFFGVPFQMNHGLTTANQHTFTGENNFRYIAALDAMVYLT